MKIKIIRTYNQNAFEQELEEMYQNYRVINVDTHTEVLKIRQEDVIYYIAIVFYKENIQSYDIESKEKFNVNFQGNLKIKLPIKNAIKEYNEEHKDNQIETINDIIEFINSGKIYNYRNIGLATVNELKDMIIEFDKKEG